MTHRIAIALVCLLALFFTLPAAAATRIALLIGNTAYEGVSPLRNASNDARLLASTLEDLGFEVELIIDADRRTMARSIRDFGKRLDNAGSDAVGLFFYAGHGVQAHGTNYLLPLNAEVLSEPDLDIEAVNANWVLGQMERAGNALNIVILDACRNNPYRSSFRSSERGLARLTAPSGSVVAYSAAPGQVALDGQGDNSPYTTALVEAMREPGVELLRMFRQVRVSVEAETDGNQTPWEEQSLTGDFYFTPEETEVAAIEPEAGTQQQQQQQQQPDQGGLLPALTPEFGLNAVEVTFWNSVKDSLNPSEIQAYIDAFPDGVFVALAELRIAALRQELEEEDDSFTGGGEGQAQGWVGIQIQEVTQDIATSLGMTTPTGAFVQDVVPGGPAQAAGIQPGDVIIRFNDQPVPTFRDLPLMITALRPGLVVVVDVYRNRQEIPLAISIADTAERDRLLAAYEAQQEQQQSAPDNQQAAIVPQQQPDVPNTPVPNPQPQDNAAQAEEWYQTGEQYYFGRGVNQDYLEAIKWYRQAAQYEHAEALYSIGYMYARGEGVNLDYLEAVHWLKRAAAQDHARSMGELGYLYWEGLGVTQDYAESAHWHRRAADLGYDYSMVNIAILLDEGRGVTAEPAAAARYLVDAFALNNSDARRWLFEQSDQWATATRREVQRILQNAGVYSGSLDGAIGPASRQALEAYKTRYGG